MKKIAVWLATATSLCSLSAYATSPTMTASQHNSYITQLQQLEQEYHGHLGIAAINTATNRKILFNDNQRFPFCSTSKVMTVAAILKQSESNPQLLQKKIHYTAEEVKSSGYAPITAKYVTNGMTVAELAQAAIDYSDNGAMNQLLKLAGGAQNVTQFARTLGDDKFNLIRSEPQLNSAIPGDVRDTTTPAAMAVSLQQLALESALMLPQQQLLQQWLKGNTTGDKRIRAGVPQDWIVGDKTGTGSYGTTNDVAVIWPPHAKPIVVVIYFTQDKKDVRPQDEVIAQATKIIVNEITR